MGIAGVGAWTVGGNRVRRAELALPCPEVVATPGGRFTNRASVGYRGPQAISFGCIIWVSSFFSL